MGFMKAQVLNHIDPADLIGEWIDDELGTALGRTPTFDEVEAVVYALPEFVRREDIEKIVREKFRIAG